MLNEVIPFHYGPTINPIQHKTPHSTKYIKYDPALKVSQTQFRVLCKLYPVLLVTLGDR